MAEDKQPNFALLIGKRLDKKDRGKPIDDSPEPEEDADSDAMQNSAIADLLSAITAKNVPKAKMALKDFIMLCQEEQPSEEEPEEEPEEG